MIVAGPDVAIFTPMYEGSVLVIAILSWLGVKHKFSTIYLKSSKLRSLLIDSANSSKNYSFVDKAFLKYFKLSVFIC